MFRERNRFVPSDILFNLSTYDDRRFVIRVQAANNIIERGGIR